MSNVFLSKWLICSRSALVVLLGACLLLLGLTGCQPAPQIVTFSGFTMGTQYNIRFVGEQTMAEGLKAKVDTRLQAVNDSMSNWQQESTISRFNRHHSSEPMAIDADFATVMQESLWLGEQTLGALDVTLGPVIDLWGFGPQGRVTQAPTEAAIRAAQVFTGLDKLALNGLMLSKSEPQLSLSFSAIAKGFGVDAVAELLEQHDIGNYMVEIGGELRTRGQKPDGNGWRIAVERPESSGREAFVVIEPGNNAVATSGDYRNYFEQEGQRFSHLLDPRTGQPITNRLASVTVISPSCMRADGLATGFSILGAEAALAYAEANQLAIMLIEQNLAGELVTRYSSYFESYLR
ncbi:MAG: FAD:protein FMN transferase [Ferrimonas sp.]